MSEMRLDVYIHKDGNSDDTVTPKSDKAAQKTFASAKTTAQKNAAKASNGDSFFASNSKSAKIAVAGVSGLAISAVKYHVGNVYARQGDSNKQDKANYAMGVGLKAVGVGLAFAKGGVVGGALALAAWGLDMAKRADEYNHNAMIESINLSAARQRAGASMNRSRG